MNMLPKKSKKSYPSFILLIIVFLVLFGFRFHGFAEENEYPIVEWNFSSDNDNDIETFYLADESINLSAVCDFGPDDSVRYVRFWWWKDSEGQELKVDSDLTNEDDDAYENSQSYLIRFADVDDEEWDGISFNYELDLLDPEVKSENYEWLGDWKLRCACKSVDGVYKHSETIITIEESNSELTDDLEANQGASQDNSDNTSSDNSTEQDLGSDLESDGSQNSDSTDTEESFLENDSNNDPDNEIEDPVNEDQSDVIDECQNKNSSSVNPISNSCENVDESTNGLIVEEGYDESSDSNLSNQLDSSDNFETSSIQEYSMPSSDSELGYLEGSNTYDSNSDYTNESSETVRVENNGDTLVAKDNPLVELEEDVNILGESSEVKESEEMKDSIGGGMKLLLALIGAPVILGMVILLLNKS